MMIVSYGMGFFFIYLFIYFFLSLNALMLVVSVRWVFYLDALMLVVSYVRFVILIFLLV